MLTQHSEPPATSLTLAIRRSEAGSTSLGQILFTAVLSAIVAWCVAHFQLERGQAFWVEQQQILNRQRLHEARLDHVRDIERLQFEHESGSFYHMVGHVNELFDYREGKMDATREAGLRATHSTEMANLYSNRAKLVSRLRTTKFFFNAKTTKASDDLITYIESSAWHYYLPIAEINRKLDVAEAANEDIHEKLYDDVRQAIGQEKYNALCRTFIDEAMSEIARDMNIER